jgi:lipoprotein NlpD
MLPYSDQAVAEIQKLQEVVRKPEPVVVAKVEPKLEPKPEPKPKLEVINDTVPSDESLEWGMPTLGKVIAEFSESDNRKGIDITGTKGQNIVASAAGKVVYSGNGLRGYGKLIIIKHNNTYLSAYAHNDQVMVKEGQTVTKGQKIAEMGNTDSDQVELHFEIRKLGKPVDPSKYLTYSRP